MWKQQFPSQKLHTAQNSDQLNGKICETKNKNKQNQSLTTDRDKDYLAIARTYTILVCHFQSASKQKASFQA